PGIERGLAAAKLSDLRLGEAEHLAERRVGSKAIVAVVDLAYSEVDRLALLRFQGRLGVLQREIRAERGRRMRESRIEVRDETERLLQIVEECLIVRCDVVTGGNRKNCHGIVPFKADVPRNRSTRPGL